MRFGITPLGVESITSVFNDEKGMNCFLDFKFSDIVRAAAERGYKHCEITLDIFQILPIKIDEEEQKEFLALKEEFDLTYSAHFPIWSIELAAPNKFIREASIASVIDSFNIIKFLEPDIEVFVLHPSGPFAHEITSLDVDPKYKSFILSLFNGFAINSVKEIIRKTKLDKKKIGIENIEYPFEATLEIIKKLRGPQLLIDTAHFLGGFSGDQYSTGEALVKLTDEYLDITNEIHLQDFAEGEGADHAALGKGRGFPHEFLDLIDNRGFEGPVVFELSFEQARESLKFIKKHAPKVKIPTIKD